MNMILHHALFHTIWFRGLMDVAIVHSFQLRYRISFYE